MNRDLSLANEKRFSFIHTITIYPDRNNNKFHQDSLVEEIGVKKTLPEIKRVSPTKLNKESIVTSSSALCSRDNIANNSSLKINHLENIPSTISNYWYSFSDDNKISSVIYIPELEIKNSSKKSIFNHYLDKILLIFAGGYFCFVFWWLFATKNALFPIFLSSKESISQADIEFIDYMKQSLEVIDRIAIKQSSTKNIALKEQNSEVAYVPVYTPTPLNSNNQNNLTTLLPPPPPPNDLAVLNPPISTIKIQPPIPPSESVKVKTTSTESSLENSEDIVTKSLSESKNSNEIATNVISNIEHTLVGLMELKEGSAALFKINGVTQRIWLGEKIESTGWVLDSVTNQKAKISHNGKIITLSVGESFQENR